MIIPNLKINRQDFGDERDIHINGRVVPGIEVRGSLRSDEWMLYEPIVTEGTIKDKKYYFITRILPNYWEYLKDNALGAVVFNIRGYNEIIPDWASTNEKFAGIPAKYLKDLSDRNIQHLFQSEEAWEEEFQEEIEDADPEEDAEWIANRRKEFFGDLYNLTTEDPDSYVYLDLYEHSGQVWSCHGCGPQCRWDTTPAAAVLLLDEYWTKIRKEDPDRFWKVFHWYMKRLGGSQRTVVSGVVCIDADTYERVKKEDFECVYTLDTLFEELDEGDEPLEEVSAMLYDLTGAKDLKVVQDVEFKERHALII